MRPTTDPPTIIEEIQELHGTEERCKEQAYMMLNMIMIEGKKVFQKTNQNVKMKLDGGASVNLMPTSVYRRINPQMFDHNGTLWLEDFIRNGSIC